MTTGQVRQVGVVGLGNMGWPMAANLVRADFEVTVADATSGRAEAFAAAVGGQAGDVPVTAQAADVLITMLPTSAHVGVVLAQAREFLRPGAIVMEMSSGLPAATRDFASQLAQGGVHLVDCPVSGGVARAETGELAIMAGGEDSDLEAVRPVLAVIGTSVHRCGGVGAGQAMKALNNLVSAAGLLITNEALLIGQKFGLDPDLMVEVLNASSGMNDSTQRKIRQFVLSRTFDSGFGLDLMAKDLSIAMDIAHASQAVTPFAALGQQLWAAAATLLGPGQDHTAIARFTEAIGGAELRSAG